jgi:hypothetical protein
MEGLCKREPTALILDECQTWYDASPDPGFLVTGLAVSPDGRTG